jgi:hypothetical protein
MCKSVVDKFAADHIESLQAEFAEYEDSNLTPAEVAELAQAKAEGRVVVLPCKVGDTVHVRSDTWGNTWNFKTIEHGKFLVGEIVSAIVTRKQTLIKIQVEHNVAWKRERKRYPISAIGKTVFLTREAAEKASKECEK